MENKVYGLTGSIASGKSTISEILKKEGFNIVDADEISRNSTKKGNKGLEHIVKQFGPDILDTLGNLDRKKLSDIVFQSKEKLELLNKTLHPIIIEEIKSQIENYKNTTSKPIILDAPLLFETGIDKFCKSVILVYANEEVQICRLMKRDNITRQKAMDIIQKQMPLEEKKKKSNLLIDNSGTLEELKIKINQLINKINEGNVC